jgi:hypothetical protein
MKKYFMAGATALLCAVAVSQAFADPVTTSQGKGADTSVRGGSYSGRAWGAEPIIRVCNNAELEHTRKAYVRFDLSALPSPVKSAKSATLSLTIGAAVGNSPADKVWTFEVFGLKDGNAGEGWDEGTINWNNAPANEVTSTSLVTADVVSLGTFTLTGKGEEGKTSSFSSPEFLKFLLGDTDGKATLIVTRQEQGNIVHIFAAKENDHLAPPSLNVGF